MPPILELAKQIGCEKKQIIVGYRNDETFLKTEFEQKRGSIYFLQRTEVRERKAM